MGIMFQRIDIPAEAALAASMLYYPPRGLRGMAKMIRASGFGRSVNDEVSMQKNILGFCTVETLKTVK